MSNSHFSRRSCVLSSEFQSFVDQEVQKSTDTLIKELKQTEKLALAIIKGHTASYHGRFWLP